MESPVGLNLLAVPPEWAFPPPRPPCAALEWWMSILCLFWRMSSIVSERLEDTYTKLTHGFAASVLR